MIFHCTKLHCTNLLENDSSFHVVTNPMEYDEDFKLENINNEINGSLI